MGVSIEIGKGRRKHGKAAIGGNLTIYEAAEGKKALLDALDSVAELEINLSAVAEMDTAGVQLLVLLKQVAAASGKKLHLVAHSPASLDVLDCYKLAAFFGDPVVIPSRRKSRRN